MWQTSFLYIISTNNMAWGRDGHKTVVNKKTVVRQENVGVVGQEERVGGCCIPPTPAST
jgi:hypothetical protein